MIVREMSTRFGSKPGGYIWALLEPVGYIAMMTVIFGAIAHTPALGTNFILFFATGYLGYQLYQAKLHTWAEPYAPTNPCSAIQMWRQSMRSRRGTYCKH